jgi:hypothetical protein
MADHYVALNVGVEGFTYADFITGTASTAGTNLVELRIQDSTNLTRKDIDNMLEAFQRFFQNPQQVVAAGFLINL